LEYGLVPAEIALEQFQQKCAAFSRLELRKNKGPERFRVSVKNGNVPVALVSRKPVRFVAMRMVLPTGASVAA
jgi:hypothetical protein